MTELISTDLIENSIATSRNIQELFSVANGKTAYGVLASIIGDNITFLDTLAENIGGKIASTKVKELYDKQYFDPKYGSARNFFNRNIYLDPNKRIKLEQARGKKSVLTQVITEYSIKLGIRGIQKCLSEVDKYKTIEDVYIFLHAFSNYGEESINSERVKIELSKILKSFSLNRFQREQMISNINIPQSLQEIVDKCKFISSENSELKDSISYLLFAIHVQKYQEYEADNIKDLLEFYNLLGYHELYAKELIRENRQKYTEITDDQVSYLKFARMLVNKIIIDIPEIDMERIKNRAEQMAKYDPYSLRRKKVQSTIAGGGVMLGAFFQKRPDVIIHGASTALSQIKLENNDNVVEFLEERFKKNGLDSDVFKTILDGRKNIINNLSFDTNIEQKLL